MLYSCFHISPIINLTLNSHDVLVIQENMIMDNMPGEKYARRKDSGKGNFWQRRNLSHSHALYRVRIHNRLYIVALIVF